MDLIDQFARALSGSKETLPRRPDRRRLMKWAGKLSIGALVAGPAAHQASREAEAACFNHTSVLAASNRIVYADALNCRTGPHTTCAVFDVLYCGDEFRTVTYIDDGDNIGNCCGTYDNRWYGIEAPVDPNYACFLSRSWTSFFGCYCCGVNLTEDGDPIAVG